MSNKASSFPNCQTSATTIREAAGLVADCGHVLCATHIVSGPVMVTSGLNPKIDELFDKYRVDLIFRRGES